MRAAEVTGFLAELAALGVTVEPDGAGGLRVGVPRSAVSSAEVARRVRSAKPALLEHFARAAEGPELAPPPVLPRRPGLPGWQGDPELYGADALPRRHAPPPKQPTEDRPHASPVKLCGGCARWSPDAPGAEGGGCSAGWAAHDLPPMPELGPLPVTSRGSRCWAWGGKGWRRAVRA
jgi:hypothetical protein